MGRAHAKSVIVGVARGLLPTVSMGEAQLTIAAVGATRALGRAPCRGVVHVRCDGCGRRTKRSLICTRHCNECLAQAEVRSAALSRALPNVPVRQWTLALPPEIRDALPRTPALLNSVGRAFVGELFAMHRVRAEVAAGEPAQSGAVSVVHGFGAALDRNLHVQVLALDGVYRVVDGTLCFDRMRRRPDSRAIGRMAARLSTFVARAVPEAEERCRHPRRAHRPARAPPPPREATRRISVNTADRRRPSPAARPGDPPRPPLKVVVDGFTVITGDVVEADDAHAITALIRRVVHPPFASHGFQPTRGGRVRYRLSNPPTGDATYIELPRAHLRARLAAIAGERNAGRVSYHGVLAPGAASRWLARPTQLRVV